MNYITFKDFLVKNKQTKCSLEAKGLKKDQNFIVKAFTIDGK